MDAELSEALAGIERRLEAIEERLGMGPLRPGETRDVGGGNSVHMHAGAHCWCGYRLGGNGGGFVGPVPRLP